MSSPPGYIYVQNIGGGIMNWAAVTNYLDGSGWLSLYQPTNQNSATVTVAAQPRTSRPASITPTC